MLIALDHAGWDGLLEEMPIADAPMIDPGAAGQSHRANLCGRFRKGPARQCLPAGHASLRWIPSDEICKLVGLAGRMARIGAEPKLDAVRHRRANLEASAEPVRRNRILEQHA